MSKNKEQKKKEKNTKKKKKSKHIILKIFLIILILIIASIGYLAYKTKKNGGGMTGLLTTVMGQEDVPIEEVDPINILVLGTSQNMSDTIMVCSYNPKTQEASMLSIPRDTYTGKNKNNAQAYEKINSRYIAQGVDGVKKYLKQILGIDLNYYVSIDTEALIKLVDEIGGVYFDVPIDMDYDDETQDLAIHLKAGYQLIDGPKAEQLLRFRHNNDGTSYPIEYGDNDYGRTRTQRNFITETIKQSLKASNIFKLGKILDIANKYVDTNIDINLAKKYIPHIINFNTENIKSGLLPGKSELCNGVWIFLPDKKETNAIVEDYFMYKDEEENTEQNNSIKIEVLNGSGVTANLSAVTEKLKKAGYNISKTGTTTETAKTTIINATKQSTETTNKIKEILGTGIISTSTANTETDLKIIIGKDYK